MSSDKNNESKGRKSDETDYKVKRSEKKTVSWKSQISVFFLPLIIIVCCIIILFQAQALRLMQQNLSSLERQQQRIHEQATEFETINSLNKKLRDCQQSGSAPNNSGVSNQIVPSP